MNHQIKAILWKNIKIAKGTEILKECFIPFLSVIILIAAKQNESIGNIFLELMIPIYIPSAVNGLLRQFLVEYVNEKQNKLRDIYKIMGLRLSNYRVAWFITYFVKSLITLMIIGLSITFIGITSFENSLAINFSFVLFIIASVSESMLLSVFFRDPQVAGEFGSFILTLTALFYFLIFIAKSNPYAYTLITIFPQSAFSLIVMSYISKQPMLMELEINRTQINLIMIAFSIVCLILYVYIENVKDENNQDGWLYCCRRRNKSVAIGDIEMQPYTTLSESQDNEKLLERSTITIKNLNKYFGVNQAVKDISLQVNEKNIFCILGHNGAGKTTTINILTGLLNKNSGDVSIFGLDADSCRQQIASRIGYCSQESVLYGELTVLQSLMYQGLLRGLSHDKLHYECYKIIESMGLGVYCNVEIAKLSGGNRRKVALGVSLMAGSDLIFLDEPTASLDPNSKRQIWDILKKLKQMNKTIILSTHFMDEAEYLADKIAILKHGQLVGMGTAQQIKEQFKVGYTLDIYDSIGYLVRIRNAFENDEVTTIDNNIRVLLTHEQIYKYRHKIQELEELQLRMKLTQNTLEDAYIKLNKEDDSQLNLEIDEDVFQMQITSSPVIRFALQFIALVLRKYYATIRSFSVLIMILLPIGFLLFGMLVGSKYLNNLKDEYIDMKIFFISLFIVQAFSLNSSIFISTPLVERELKIRQQLKLLKCSQLAYWSSTLMADFVIVSITNVAIYIMLTAGYTQFYEPYVVSTLVVLQAFGVSIIVYSYFCSFLFATSRSAYKLFPVYNFLLCYSLPQILTDIVFLSNSQFYRLASLISPLFALDRALRRIQIDEHWDIIYIMMLQSVIYMMLVFTIENYTTLFKNSKSSQDDSISITELSHRYEKSNKNQLQDVSLEISEKRVLSLLGPNGAGKSTLIRILTDCTRKQKGVILQPSNYQISVCQQDEGLWDDLKPIEILMLYSLIKGGVFQITQEVIQMLSALQISDNKCIKYLSGGQRRKVAIAMALIGCDQAIILDEPSNGLDPVSRRSLWKLIKQHVQKHKSSIILTTHDMDEAQNLSDQVGILIKGQLVENDTLQGLINRLGTGIKIVMQTTQDEQFANELNPISVEHKDNTIIAHMGDDQCISQTLSTLQRLENEEIISGFQIVEANLEQVFMKLTQLQYIE